MDSVLLRCRSCGSVNRVLAKKLADRPRCGRCGAVISFPDRAADVTARTFQKEVLSEPGTVLVEFWSPTCQHCLRLRSVTDELAREMAGTVKFTRVNIAMDQQLAFQFNVRSTPTLVLYRGGNKIKDLPGAVPKPQLAQWIRESL